MKGQPLEKNIPTKIHWPNFLLKHISTKLLGTHYIGIENFAKWEDYIVRTF
jgi:hypothetical protein